jgi:hypothetical protein
MCPLAASDGDGARGQVDQLVPGITAMIDDLVVGFEDAVGEELWLNLVFEWFEGWRRIWLNCCCETACQPKEIHHHGND